MFVAPLAGNSCVGPLGSRNEVVNFLVVPQPLASMAETAATRQ